MTTSPILILGGKGKTGRRVVAKLEAKGVPVRLASRSSERRFDWYDEGTWAGIDTDDIGDVMATVLLDERHSGQAYSLSGPRTLTMSEVADELSTATGRRV